MNNGGGGDVQQSHEYHQQTHVPTVANPDLNHLMCLTVMEGDGSVEQQAEQRQEEPQQSESRPETPPENVKNTRSRSKPKPGPKSKTSPPAKKKNDKKKGRNLTPIMDSGVLRSRLEKAVVKLQEKDVEIEKLKKKLDTQRESFLKKESQSADNEVEVKKLRAENDKLRIENARLTGQLEEGEKWKSMVNTLLGMAQMMSANAPRTPNGSGSINPIHFS